MCVHGYSDLFNPFHAAPGPQPGSENAPNSDDILLPMYVECTQALLVGGY